MENWNEVLNQAKTSAVKCRCCPICNGLACRGETPGVGGKGSGSSFVRNFESLRHILLVMDTIVSNEEVDTSADFFGHKVSLPVYAAPISGINQNYGAEMSDGEYSEYLVEGCLKAGTLAFTGDGMIDAMFTDPLDVIKKHGGLGVPTIKPWSKDAFTWRAEAAKEAGVLAVATDVDASGLANLRNSTTPVGFKDVDSLQEIKQLVAKPLIVKGVLSVTGAMKALAAGADGILVSNHGGRVLDDCLSGMDVLEEIVQAVKGRMKIFVDGAFRSGTDVFKALALGADGVLIGRPLSLAVIGDHVEGVEIYFQKITQELKDAMAMTGCKKITDITRDKVRFID